MVWCTIISYRRVKLRFIIKPHFNFKKKKLNCTRCSCVIHFMYQSVPLPRRTRSREVNKKSKKSLSDPKQFTLPWLSTPSQHAKRYKSIIPLGNTLLFGFLSFMYFHWPCSLFLRHPNLSTKLTTTGKLLTKNICIFYYISLNIQPPPLIIQIILLHMVAANPYSLSISWIRIFKQYCKSLSA